MTGTEETTPEVTLVVETRTGTEEITEEVSLVETTTRVVFVTALVVETRVVLFVTALVVETTGTELLVTALVVETTGTELLVTALVVETTGVEVAMDVTVQGQLYHGPAVSTTYLRGHMKPRYRFVSRLARTRWGMPRTW